MSQFDWPIKKKVETMEAPQIEDSNKRCSASPIGLYRRGGFWAKHMGLK
jgi:hypothetical protein